MNNRSISEDLFLTHAVRVAPADTPFWYTSGKLGPFYINTHFLVKDEQEANRMLSVIEDSIKEDKLTAPKKIFDEFMKLYQSSESFKNVTDKLVETARKYDFDYISGGERRDFFFSMLPAHILGKPHITIFKDCTAVVTSSEFTSAKTADEATLKGKKVLHIADLITEASSYERAWIPVIRGLGAEITDTVAVIDRHQNGRAVLEGLGVEMETLAGIDKELFDKGLDSNYIDQAQYDLVMDFLADPDKYMKSFIAAHPTFIDDQIALGGKAKERAELAVSKGFV
ncbi:orotate phosphoribosyltransferase [Ruminococcaceae bacterium KH2T8]|nr:orotate phosphoribosyltransferase [Ruminococcaceae bacterium KH2T8]